MTARFEVQIVNPADGKPKLWDSYSSRERAETVAATLRHHGFFVQVRVAAGNPAPDGISTEEAESKSAGNPAPIDTIAALGDEPEPDLPRAA